MFFTSTLLHFIIVHSFATFMPSGLFHNEAFSNNLLYVFVNVDIYLFIKWLKPKGNSLGCFNLKS